MTSARLSFEAIGTRWTIEIFDHVSEQLLDSIEEAIRKRIDEFDRTYSRFRQDSLVTQMAAEAGRYTLPDDAAALFAVYRKLYDATAGKVTPLIGQTLSDAGYDAGYSLQPGTVGKPPAWEDILEYEAPHLLLKQQALLDFGAAGKGYLADIIGQLLQDSGLKNFAVNAGGDIVYRTATGKSLRIGLEHPNDPQMAVGVARIHNQSLCGSAVNRRKWAHYTHIIDPVMLESPRGIAALWVVADDGLTADGVTTALFFASPVKLRQHFQFEYAIIHADMSLVRSPGFPAEFFTEQNTQKGR